MADKQEKYSDAITAYEKARDIRQKLFPDTRDVGYCVGTLSVVLSPLNKSKLTYITHPTEQIGKCMRLQGDEDAGREMEEQGRQMKKLGLSIVELEPSASSPVASASNTAAFTPGAHTTTGHLVARIDVFDTIEPEAIESARFNFPGKLIGNRGVHLKRIEAIACAQLRYFGPWPNANKKKNSGAGGKTEAYVQITSTSEQVCATSCQCTLADSC